MTTGIERQTDGHTSQKKKIIIHVSKDDVVADAASAKDDEYVATL